MWCQRDVSLWANYFPPRSKWLRKLEGTEIHFLCVFLLFLYLKCIILFNLYKNLRNRHPFPHFTDGRTEAQPKILPKISSLLRDKNQGSNTDLFDTKFHDFYCAATLPKSGFICFKFGCEYPLSWRKFKSFIKLSPVSGRKCWHWFPPTTIFTLNLLEVAKERIS